MALFDIEGATSAHRHTAIRYTYVVISLKSVPETFRLPLHQLDVRDNILDNRRRNLSLDIAIIRLIDPDAEAVGQ